MYTTVHVEVCLYVHACAHVRTYVCVQCMCECVCVHVCVFNMIAFITNHYHDLSKLQYEWYTSYEILASED